MFISKENKKILKKITDGKSIKEKYYGIQAINKNEYGLNLKWY